MRHLLPMTLSCLAALSAGPALAQSSTPFLTATVGPATAPNESYFVLDFENATATTPDEVYAFGYRYAAPAPGVTLYGSDLLKALTNANIDLSVATTYYPSFRQSIVDSFTYKGVTEGGFQGNGYWSYYQSMNGQFSTMAPLGYGASSISNGSYDGWAWDTGANPLPLTPFASPAVPEAGAGWLALLGVPVLLLAYQKKRASETTQ